MNKAVRSLVAVAVTAVALVGCAQNPNHAAIVEGVTITEQAVTQATAAVVAAFDAPASEARTFTVNRLIQGVVAESIARDNGIAVTEEDRAQVVAQQPQLAALAAQPGGEGLVSDWVDIIVVAQSLGNEKLVAELAKHEVILNPRYGQWDPTTGSTTGTGSLSVPVEALQG